MNYKIKYQKGGFDYDSNSSSESELDTLSSEKDYKTQLLKIPIIYFDFFMKTFNLIADDPKCIRTNKDIENAVTEWLADPITGTEKYCHIRNWDTSRVTDMQDLFMNQDTFNEDISKWNVSSVTDMGGMFYEAKAFNQPLETKVVYKRDGSYYTAWDVSSVTYMNGMFIKAEAFNKNINSWNVSSVTSMKEMFTDAKSFDQNIDSWNVKATVDKTNMFNGSAISQLPSWYP